MAPTEVIERLCVTAQELRGVCVLGVSGELDEWTAPALAERIADAAPDAILVDLTELAFYDPSGLPALEAAIAAERAPLLVVAPARPEAARAFAGAWGRLPLAADARAALDELART